MGNLTGYDPTQVEADTGFQPLPAGDYPVMAVKSEVKDTKAGTGKYLSVEFEVFEGEGKGRKIFMNFNILNPNPQAQQIGQSQLKGFATACNKPNAEDSSEWHGIPVIAKVVVSKSEQHGDGNNIKSFAPYQSGGAVATAPATGATKKPDWAA